MKINELKTGMKVVTKNGCQFIVMKDTPWGDGLIGQSTLNGILLSEYRNDLVHKESSGLDIIEVYQNWRMTNIELNNIELPSHGYRLIEKIL